MSSENKSSKKHHHVPQFYLKRWSQNNPDKELFSGRFFDNENKIAWGQFSPGGTCYKIDLYGEIEELFFKPLDNNAAKIVNTLGSQNIINPVKFDLSEKGHEDWAIFILGLLIRTPDNIKFIQDVFGRASINLDTTKNQFPEIIKNKKAIKDLRSLEWLFARVDSNLELITCDNPLIFEPKNLSHPNCVIILPMGPKHFFLAARQDTIRRLEMNPRKMVSNINTAIILNAKSRIYARKRSSIEEEFVIKIRKKLTSIHPTFLST